MDNYTSAQERHKDMPTSQGHWTRSQMRCASVLAVRAKPIPEALAAEELAIEIRREKLASAWSMMQSCDTDLWTDVCNLYALVVAAEKDISKNVITEVAEAKDLMQNAKLLSAVETIESFHIEEWKQETNPACVRRGSSLMVHEHESSETPPEAQVRHVQHAEAWELMKKCDNAQWAAACRYNEEQNKASIAKREKLDAACWVLQDFNTQIWERPKDLPKSMNKHAACLTVHRTTPRASESNEGVDNDPVYQTHRRCLIEAWGTMKDTDQGDWLKACKAHEDFVMNIRASPVRNGVGSHAA